MELESCQRAAPASNRLTHPTRNLLRRGSPRMRTALSHWKGLIRFLADGRLELDTNTVERSIRPQALTRKNALFAGSDGGAQHWACLASLIETSKLNAVDPLAYLTDVLARLAQGHPVNRVAELLPWRWAPAASSPV